MSPFVKRRTCLIVWITVWGFAVCCLGQESTPAAGKLKFELDVKRAEVRKPLGELQKKYDQALERLEAAEQKKGNLKALLEVREERKAFKTRSETPEPARALPKLNELRTIYERESARLKSEIITGETRLLSEYIASLGAMAKGLTRKGEIDEALKISKIGDAAREELAGIKKGFGIGRKEHGSGGGVVILGDGGKYQAHDQSEVSRKGDRFLIFSSAANAPVQSREDFKPPFRMLARAETDGSLRFYFGENGIVIFNWDINAGTLKIGDPGTPMPMQAGFEDQGALKFGQTYDFEIVVETESITVKVDGKVKGELKGNFSETGAGPAGISSSRGSHVLVDYFKAIPGEAKE